jgi:hypothetical protein
VRASPSPPRRGPSGASRSDGRGDPGRVLRTLDLEVPRAGNMVGEVSAALHRNDVVAGMDDQGGRGERRQDRPHVDYAGRGRAVWKPRFHVLALPGPSGYLFNLAALDQRTPCHPGARQAPGESTPDFLARTIREDHGFTVPGRSLLAPDVVEGQE